MLHDSVATSRVQRLGQSLVLISLLTLLLSRGGTSSLAVLAACIPLCIACGIAVIAPVQSTGTSQTRSAAFLVGLVVVSYIFFQAWDYSGAPILGQLLSSLPFRAAPGAISVAPEMTRSAAFTAALPFMFYFASISLFSGKGYSIKLLNLLSLTGGLFAVFGMLQLLLFPTTMIFSEKTSYLAYLTGTFVNRNTAGTFLGLASLAALASALAARKEQNYGRSIVVESGEVNPGTLRRWAISLHSAAFLLSLYGLFLTQSRGALLSAILAYIVVLPLLFSGQSARSSALTSKRESIVSSSYKRPLLAVAGVLVVVAIIAVFGGQALYRLERQALDIGRLCIYSATTHAFLDNWMVGTGFGTFEVVFPQYRTEACGFINSTFVRAHNSYLEALAGLGVIFIPLFVAVTGLILRNLHLGFKNRSRSRFIPVIGLGAVIMVYSHAVVDFSLQIPALAAYFSMLLASISSICLERRRPLRSQR